MEYDWSLDQILQIFTYDLKDYIIFKLVLVLLVLAEKMIKCY